jgi:alpha-glucosidase (family GH31 glycosyl hydrolase)
MRRFLYTFLIVIIGQVVLAQNPSRHFEAVTKKDNYYQVSVNDGTYRIQFYTPEIVETSFIPEGKKYIPQSHAVVMAPQDVTATVSETDNDITIETEGISILIRKKPFQVSYLQNDQVIISEKSGYLKDSLEKLQFNLTAEEALYGGGARALNMKRRGYRLELYNRAHYGYEKTSELMNYTMPVVLSSNQYLVHFDNPAIGFLDMDSRENNTLTYETIAGRKTYQVVVGNSWLEIIDNYTDLTGKQPLLPRWAMGNFSSRFGYHSQQETIETIEKFRKESIPVDAVVLDLYWFGKTIKGTMGNLAFYKDSFPEPEQMIRTLEDLQTETILITEPFILTTSKRWDEAVKEGIIATDSTGEVYTYDFYFGHTGLIDIFEENGYNWFKDIYKDLLNMGVTGMWGDLGEPEVHPSALRHGNKTADEVHNIYGHEWTKLVDEAYHEFDPSMRPFILMRAGYSGTQRYGIIPWTGDVNRTWGGLYSQPAISLQMGMQGIGYMHSDLGGFAGANLDDELYVRWLQYGVFQPVYRPHAQEEVPSEPVFRSQKAKNLSRKAIELRYQLLPYNYHLTYLNHTTGAPLMRPLFFEEPDNEKLFHYADAYLWGPDFLVAPVKEPAIKKKKVYFPRTSNWFDFYTGEKYVGGQTKIVDVQEEYIPTFVRGGAFIPMTRTIQSVKEYKGEKLFIHYYYDPEINRSQSELYNDDGLTADAVSKDEYEIMQFTANLESGKMAFGFSAETGKNYQSSTKAVNLIVHNMKEKPNKITVNGNEADINWNQKNQTVSLPLVWNTNKEMTIQLYEKGLP